jgi:hypothetical protein
MTGKWTFQSDSNSSDPGSDNDETDDHNVVILYDSSLLYCPIPLPFTANVGINVVIRFCESVVPYIFCTPELYQHLVHQTSLYGSRAISAIICSFTEYSLYQTWVAVIMEEMRFLGRTFITGIIKKPKLKIYWIYCLFGIPVFFPKQCLYWVQGHFSPYTLSWQ